MQRLRSNPMLLTIFSPKVAIKICSVGAILLLWQVASTRGWLPQLFFPSPSEVWLEASSLFRDGEIWQAVLISSRRVFSGFGLAALISIPLGVMMAVWWPVKATFDPLVSLLRPLPSITWIPLTILWLGIGEGQKTAIVFAGTWIYVLLYTYESTRRVDPMLVLAARNLGANSFQIMRVVLMAALPGIISGLKVTLAIAWSCVITAEMVAAQIGLGAIIWRAKDGANLGLVLVGMIGISITVLIADFVVDRLEYLFLPWERLRR